MELNGNLVREKVSKLLMSYSVPCIISLLVGALYNIVDQIFIANASYLGSYGNAANTVVFPLTVIALAVATVIGQIVTVILAINYLCNMKIVKLEKQNFVLNISIVKNTIILGVTSFLSQISLVAAMAAVNNMIRKYSLQDQVFSQVQYAQIPMAVVGIVMKFFQIVISIVVGMAAGFIPVVGYNIGAKLYKRVKDIFILLLKAETIVGIISFIIVEVFPKFLINIFGATNESIYYTEFAIKSFRIYLCMIILACINKATFIFLQAMGKAKESMILSMVREIVFGVGFALLLPQYFGLDGVLYSMPLSDLLTFIIAVYLICKVMKEFNKNLLLNR